MTNRMNGLRLALVAGALAGFAGLSPALAGSCPKESVLTKPRTIEDVPEKFLKRMTLAEVFLKGWRGLGELSLRTRRLTIAPGGFVPTHYHDDRPSIVYIVSGEIWEHSTFCAVPILHKAGEYTEEFGPYHGHWWENKGTETVVLTSSDVIPPEYRDEPEK